MKKEYSSSYAGSTYFKKNRALRYSLLVVSIVLIFLGILRGEARTVLQKAVLICLECIGIG